MTLEPCASAPILTPMSPPRRILSIWLARLSVDRWRRAHAPDAQAAADAAPTALILETAHGPRIEVGGDDRAVAGAEQHLELNAAPVLLVQIDDPLPVALLKIKGGNVRIVFNQFFGL